MTSIKHRTAALLLAALIAAAGAFAALLRGRFCGQAFFSDGFDGNVTANSPRNDCIESHALVKNLGGDY